MRHKIIDNYDLVLEPKISEKGAVSVTNGAWK
jgi:hypothetical protein